MFAVSLTCHVISLKSDTVFSIHLSCSLKLQSLAAVESPARPFFSHSLLCKCSICICLERNLMLLFWGMFLPSAIWPMSHQIADNFPHIQKNTVEKSRKSMEFLTFRWMLIVTSHNNNARRKSRCWWCLMDFGCGLTVNNSPIALFRAWKSSKLDSSPGGITVTDSGEWKISSQKSIDQVIIADFVGH